MKKLIHQGIRTYSHDELVEHVDDLCEKVDALAGLLKQGDILCFEHIRNNRYLRTIWQGLKSIASEVECGLPDVYHELNSVVEIDEMVLE